MRDAQLAAFFAGAIRLAMPVLFAAVGELVSERAGVLNLSLEGLMLTGAFGAALGAHATGSPIVGVFAGVGLALLLALVLAVLSVTLGANQLVLGIAAVADRVAFLSAGRVTEEGPADQVLRQPEDPATASFLRVVSADTFTVGRA